MYPPRLTILALLPLLALPVGCARTLHYPSRAEGPAMGAPGRGDVGVAAASQGGDASSSSSKSPSTSSTKGRGKKSQEQPSGNRLGEGSLETGVSSSPGSPLFAAPSKAGHPEVASLARSYVGHTGGTLTVDGTRFRMDCSGFVRAVYSGFGVELFSTPGPAGASGTHYIYRYAQEVGAVYERGEAAPGDIVFFHNSYDRNHNGKRDDAFTHVALVESVDKRGTVTMIHTTRGKVKRGKMNLRYPDTHRDPDSGEILNDYLRRAEGGHASMLMSQLFAGFGRVPLKTKAS